MFRMRLPGGAVLAASIAAALLSGGWSRLLGFELRPSASRPKAA